MIISKQEFKELGFECDAQSESRLEGCIKRAEYILNALCGGTLKAAMSRSGSAALIKQAAAFEANALLKAESVTSAELTGSSEKVALGDLSYTESSTYGQREEAVAAEAFDVSETVKRLLYAAGCSFGTGITEVIE